jgi:hypothetical protein
MTVLDFDTTQKTCSACNAERLLFIVDAPALWPVGDTVRYRCKVCATTEAEAGGDPIAVIFHREKQTLTGAWETEKVSRWRSNSLSMGSRRSISSSDGELEDILRAPGAKGVHPDVAPVSRRRRPPSQEAAG